MASSNPTIPYILDSPNPIIALNMPIIPKTSNEKHVPHVAIKVA